MAGPTLPTTAQTTGSSASAPTPALSETTEAEPAQPATNARGNLAKALGEEARITDPSTRATLVTFAVDTITPDPQCGPYAEPPANGHFVALDMRFATGPDIEPLGHFLVNPYDFSFIGADGITYTELATGPAYICVDPTETFSSEPLGPAQQYVGKVVLDVPASTGTLVHRPPMTEGGWEWSFSAWRTTARPGGIWHTGALGCWRSR